MALVTPWLRKTMRESALYSLSSVFVLRALLVSSQNFIWNTDDEPQKAEPQPYG